MNQIYPTPYSSADNSDACYHVYTSFIIALLITAIMILVIVFLTEKYENDDSLSGYY